MTTIPTHISRIRPGDTVEVDGHLKTVSPGDIRRGFMGTTLWEAELWLRSQSNQEPYA